MEAVEIGGEEEEGEESTSEKVEFAEKEKLAVETHTGLHIGGLVTIHLSTASISVKMCLHAIGRILICLLNLRFSSVWLFVLLLLYFAFRVGMTATT